MNLNALKNFAPAVRRQLIEAVGRKLDFVLTGDTPDLREKAQQRTSIKGKAQMDRPSLIERVAYTWFNRLAALRFLDARGWHPFLCRVITPANEEETQPEILKLTRNGALPAELVPFTDPVRNNDLLDGRIPSTDPQGEVYRLLVLAACRYYHHLMPFLFEALDDETELLLPDDLLTEHSVVQGFRDDITDDDCAEVEIIGWLYQFYIAEKKDQVMARKSAVPSEDIPAVTQIFTPHWIVRYLVENSLGRLWLLNRPGSRLREHMPYYIEGEPETDFLKINKPEEIRLLDPATGSGHMLTYSFDLLYLIYEEEGHAPSEIPGLILRHNLFGLEICPRAAQLAQFALVCKAREKSRLAFRTPIQPQVMCLEDVKITSEEMTDYLRLPGLRELFSENVLRQVHQFRENTSTFGSLIHPVLTPEEINALKSRLAMVNPGDDLLLYQTHRKVIQTIDQAEMLSQRYHVVIANPPYMGGGGMNGQLKVFAKKNYSESKSDLYAMFMERNIDLALHLGYMGMINLPSWLFLSTFKNLRKYVIDNFVIESMLHMGRGIFGIDWGSTAFIVKKSPESLKLGHYFRLHKRNFQHIYFDDIGKLYLNAKSDPGYKYDFDQYRDEAGVNDIGKKSNENGIKLYYKASAATDFTKIPGVPITYWISDRTREAFASDKPLEAVAEIRQGMATTDNKRFLRNWSEISFGEISFGNTNRNQAFLTGKSWFPYNKGGDFRKWYGNNDHIVLWENDGQVMFDLVRDKYPRISDPEFVIKNPNTYFWESVTWSGISSTAFGARYSPPGFIYDVVGSSVFPHDRDYKTLLALFCSKVAAHFVHILNPTHHFQVGDVQRIPWEAETIHKFRDIAVRIGGEAIGLARADWDNFETSWDFRDEPLLRPELKGTTLEASWRNWEAQSIVTIRRMQELETENNRLFIDAYGLQDELTPEVPEAQITLNRVDVRHDMAAFLSYTVGCMMGRYSLDEPGLILANAGETLVNYLYRVSKRTHILDPRTALAEPLSVVLREDVSPKCFSCGKINGVSDAWFILADIYDRAEGRICGRPMVYCQDCLKEKDDKICLSLRLCDFSLAEAIDKKWAEPDTFSMFLELADCFEQRTPAQPDDLMFVPDADGIIPVLDREWFDDDIVARTRDFLRATFGESTLEGNIRFIEESLGKDLRKYFMTDFYKDHLQTYKKRPIYWLFQSPKKGFSALIYLHRYTRDTVNVLLNRYLRDYLHKLQSRIEHLEHIQATSESAREKTAARKESDALKKTLRECEEYEREIILPLAQQRIELDLDDGVKVNYLKFGKALVTIPGLAAKEEDV